MAKVGDRDVGQGPRLKRIKRWAELPEAKKV